MKFRFKVSKNGGHKLQYREFIFWKDYSRNIQLSYFINRKYIDSEYLRYIPRYELSDNDYKAFIVILTKDWNDYCKKAKEEKELYKTDYYIS